MFKAKISIRKIPNGSAYFEVRVGRTEACQCYFRANTWVEAVALVYAHAAGFFDY